MLRDLLSDLRYRLRALFRHGDVERDLADEVRFHLDREAEKLAAGGIPADEARRRARLAFGGVEHVKESARDARGVRWIEDLASDVRYSLRALRRTPLFTAIVVVTLAIGIGANGAVLSIIDRMFWRKLAVPHPEQLVLISSGSTHERATHRVGWSSFPDYLDIRRDAQGVSGSIAYAMDDVALGDSLGGRRFLAAFVSGNYFAVLGALPARGRTIRPDEELPRGAHAVVVISDAFWHSQFGGAADVVGRALTIAKTKFTIIGIMPPGFVGLQAEGRTDLWLPYTMHAEAMGGPYGFDQRDARKALIFGRLLPGEHPAELQASLDRVAHALAAAYPATDGGRTLWDMPHDRLAPIAEAPAAFFEFMVVWAMIALLHLVACSNVASLMLARAASRRHELGIRICLGASRGRLVMHALTEAALLAAFGATAAVVVARWLTQLICQMQFMSAADPGLDVRVVVIIVGIAAVTTLQFGLMPALDAARRDPIDMVRGAHGAGGDAARDRAPKVILVVQLTLSIVLLANAGVLLQSFRRQTEGPSGYDSTHLIVTSLTRPMDSGPTTWLVQSDAIAAQLSAVPGVRSFAIAIGAPLFRTGRFDDVDVTGHQYRPGEERKLSLQSVGPGYFRTVGARLVSGREFNAADLASIVGGTTSAFSAAVVNETMARRFWPGQDPIGRQITYHGRAATVFGVVRDLHDVSTVGVVPRVYFPLLRQVPTEFEVLVRTDGNPADALGAVSRALGAVRGAHVTYNQTMSDLQRDVLAPERAGGIGMIICSAIALLLTALGIYGLVATWAAQRRGEIGIRLALGASARHVHTVLLGGVGRLVAIGAVIGVAGAVGLARLERSWWGPTFTLDLLPLAVTLVVISVAAMTAGFLPVRRAAAANPADVLRVG